MLKNFTAIIASLTIGFAVLSTAAAGDQSLKDRLLAIDKELLEFRQTTLNDPEVKAATAELLAAAAKQQAAVNKLRFAEDNVLIRTNSKGKELVEKYRALLEQYKAEQKAAAAKTPPKP